MKPTFNTRHLRPRKQAIVYIEPPLYSLYQKISQLVCLSLLVWAVLSFRSWVNALKEARVPQARAAEALHFTMKLADRKIELPVPDVMKKREGYWFAPKEPAYKNDRLRVYQEMLKDRGITDPDDLRLFSAQLLQENGALSENVDGDHGCSIGIPQRNTCILRDPLTGKHFTAKTFRERYPAWKDWKTQLAWMADRTVANYKRFGNARCTIIYHNRPASALAGCRDTAARYYGKIAARSASLSLL